MKVAIWWIRRDLRLSDNQALTTALDQSEAVIPAFILDTKLLASPYTGQKRLAFLFDGLRALDADLQQRGSALIVRQGDPLEMLQVLCSETGADRIFAEADVSPFARRRDERLMGELPLTLVPGVTVRPPEMLHKTDGAPYNVFTPFSRMWLSLPFPGSPLPAPERLQTPSSIASVGLPSLAWSPADAHFPAGETHAQQRLAAFTGSVISRYADERNRLDLDGTSGLSPYLRFGMLSARQAVWAAHEAAAQAGNASARKGAETWLGELIWREFYAAILYYFPFVRQTAFRSKLRRIPWRDAPDDYETWSEGRTGYPVVDAAMRQLITTGWMHNRARMITASFLTKDLLIDWRLGERYFMQHLLDGDPAANNGGWQWTAGTGTDAAPYFRVFNPVLQGTKFDPRGDYIRRWVSELAAVPNEFIHTPWKMPAGMQQHLGCIIGKDYPAPMVDHTMARQRMLAAYRQGKADDII
jgi:deoxyribodipyrimidine photo-lyase